MPVFFDPMLVERSGVGFIREGKIDEALHKLIRNAHITKGHFTYPSRSELRDLVWNHMDQNHRPYIHRTYGDAVRFFVSPSASFALTRFGRWPVVIPVFDGYFRENGFYQVIVLFGLIAVVTIIECNPDGNQTKMDVAWAIASHRWLRFLHPTLHRRFVRLNDVQNREDDTMRDQRIALRAAGYQFKTDSPDFVNSNLIDNNAIFPALPSEESIPLTDLPEKHPVRIAVANRAFVLRREGSFVDVWPGICPHEGAALNVGDISNKVVKCPWHGLEFGTRRLDAHSPVMLCGTRLDLDGDRIIVRPSVTDARS